ncbi:hypothetical protein CDQ92_13045 [Sphingopyxis bauzanensis]|uniref:Uncharacterized protein n=1 Tax=Sphingopyxis bauzanensis TaxID=651663 RepID=A0A246JRR4_9SPHN|nr:GIY-YIG nuclease family protein [Sphingopyxis bauzanensis]OWQ95707.1 hypothetical protein CDQ92_13045 [Sphingopyxis bauzanensis]
MMRVEQVNAIIRAHHESADRSECGKFCYFAAAPDGLIKIGYSKNLKMRLTKLRNNHGDDMEILAVATGGIERESAYHFQFGEHRVEGEWFERHPDILAEIERLNAKDLRNAY